LDVVSEPLHQSIGADHVEDRFESRIRHRRFFVDGFDNFAFFGVPFAYRLRGVREWVLGAGMAGSGLTSATIMIMATSSYS
jgi:hypothetical protein